MQGQSDVPGIDPKFFTLKCRMCETYTSTTRDLRTITGQSSQEGCSREAPVITEEDTHASSQLLPRWRSSCPRSLNSPRINLEWCSSIMGKDLILMRWIHFDLKVALDRGLFFYKPAVLRLFCFNAMPSEALNSETEILFDTRAPPVTEATRTKSSI